MKRSFDTASLAQQQDTFFSQDDRIMDVDEPNAYQVAMKKGNIFTI